MTSDTPAVEGLHAVKTTRDDAHREAFIKNVATCVLDMKMFDEEELCCWLRTVWLEARGEKWGSKVEVGGGEVW